MGRKHRQKPIIFPKGVIIEVDCIKTDETDRFIEGFTTSTVRLKDQKFERWLSGKHKLEKNMAQCPVCERWNNALRRVCMYCGVMLKDLPKEEPFKLPVKPKVEDKNKKIISYRQETRFLPKKLKKKLRRDFERVC